MKVFAALAVLLPAAVLAGPLNARSTPANEVDGVSNANCERKDYYVESVANRTQFNFETLLPQTNQSRYSELSVEFITNMSAFTSDYITGKAEKTHTFRISGVLCTPKENADSSRAIQLLLHGIGFDSFYWNYQGDGVPAEDYSYVYAAAAKGISTFRYDRIGTGASQMPQDGYNVIQGATEVGILKSVANMLKNTTKIGGKKWEKTLLIGHSYGSAQSQSLSQESPELIDGIILTGFSANSTGAPFYILSAIYTQASTVFPDRFGSVPQNYLVTGTPYSGQINFNYPATVIPASVKLQRSTEQPVTQGPLFTIGSLGAPAPGFTGPVQVLTGENDFIFFFDNPYENGVSLGQTAATTLYPNSKNATSFTPGRTGHAINVHTTAKKVYAEMLSFAKANNL
ncbi:hypothetical protein CBS101457_001741 [Exobasidium rhododendri]|nr:hypothetical protein CBS101457_001741 [Exobasidium rhododendri]